MILLYAVQQLENSFPGQKCEAYTTIKSTSRKRAHIIEGKGPVLLPKIYVDTSKPLGKLYNGEIIVSTRKLTNTFGKSGGLASQLSNCISDKKWRSSWLMCQANQSSSQVFMAQE